MLRYLSAAWLFFFCFFFVSTGYVSAAYSSAIIRPGTHSIGQSPLPILFVVRTSVAATEDSFKITVPSGYQLSPSASDYTVSTSLLPSTYQAWPGIGTADSVVGNQITLPSADLEPGITYGFYLTGGIISNPSALSSAESVWQLASLSSGILIEQSDVTVPVESSSTVSLTATVPPASVNFNVGLTSTSAAQLAQNQVARFALKYSTVYPTDTPLTVEASWSRGTVEGSVTPSVDVVEYVPGSVTQGFGGAEPIIDPIARTITWNIPAISSADGEQTVEFSLKTTQNYKGSDTVNFTVTGGITDPAVSVPSTVNMSYRYVPPVSTSSGSDTSSGDDAEGATPVPTSVTDSSQQSSYIEAVTVPTISDQLVEILLHLSSPGSVEVLYGTAPSLLTKRIISPDIASTHTVLLSELLPQTTYYFRIKTTFRTGTVTLSDLYTVTTSSKPLQGLEGAVLTISYKGLPLEDISGAEGFPTVILPENQNYELAVRLPDATPFKSFRITLSYDQIQNVGAAYQIPLVWIGKNTYIATITALAPYGRYRLQYDVEDYLGNKQSTVIGSLRVVRPLRIIDAESKEPVENAEVKVERFNRTFQMYEKLEDDVFGEVGTWHSDHQGIVQMGLPEGKYRLSVTATSYTNKTHEFEVTDNTAEYPLIELQRESNFILSRYSYYASTIKKALSGFNPVINSLFSSKSIFRAVSFISLCLLSAGTLLAFSVKTHIPVFKLFPYVWSKLSANKSTAKQASMQGKVININSNLPVGNAEVALMDSKKVVLETVKTTANGYFHVKLPHTPTSILITEAGFLPSTFHLPADPGKATLLFKMTNKSSFSKAESHAGAIVKFITSSLFEVLLVVCCIAQFFFVQKFGILPALPFIIISIINVVIWTFYLSTQLLPQQFTELEVEK